MWRYGWIVVFLVSGLIACTSSPPVPVRTETPTAATVAASTIAVTRIAPPAATLSPTPEPTFRPTVAPTITSQPTHTALPSPTPSPWLIQDTGNLLFYSVWWRHRETQIFVLPIGGNSRFVDYGDLLEGQPLSSDGTRLVYDPHRFPPINPSGQLAVANLKTGETTTIYVLNRPQTVFWSPDGKFLLYLQYDQAFTDETRFHARIALYDFESGENHLLTETSNILTLAGWSPDSQKVAFVSDMNGQFDLYTLDINDLTLRQLTHSSAIESVAFWSPTDNLLMFGTWFRDDLEALLRQSEPIDSARDLYLIDDLGENTQLLGDLAYQTVSWSPDGRKLAYSNNFDAICVLDIESLTEVCPANTAPLTLYYLLMPSWSSDSEWLAFRATPFDEVQCFTVFILELDTNRVTKVDTDECGNPSPAIWAYNLP